MAHLPAFITDLAIILITAGIVTIIFKWLKQPLVLGYIVAGFLAGPHIGLTPTVIDSENVTTWADIGVIFLLFALGLEFSFKKLIKVGGTASIATLINMGSMIAIGYLVGQLLGWTHMDSIFLGGMLSMSSTTIIIKAFNDMSLQKQKFARIVFGMLIVEDLAAILMMVLLSTLAVSRNFEGTEFLTSMLKLLFFMLIWFVVGIYLLPTFLKKFKKYLNDETLLIVCIGLCLGMVLFAVKVGFSSALGAFIMGSILAETIESKRIEHLIEPIKNLFGAVFFVSVGMMIAPNVVVDYAVPILILTAVVLIGRVIFATLGVMASGEGLKVSLQAGFSLAQIGEFSFIIATLGNQLGVIEDFLYPIIVAVSVITTFTTPYFIHASNGVYNVIEKRIPNNWTKILNGYSSSGYKSINTQNDWNKLLKGVTLSVAIYFTLTFAIVIVCQQFLTPFVMDKVPGIWGRVLTGFITILLMAPFLRGMLLKKNKSTEFRKLWNDSRFNKGALVSLTLVRVMLAVLLIVTALSPLFPYATAILVIIALILVALFVFTKAFRTPAVRMEQQFITNLNSKEEDSSALLERLAEDLSHRDLYIEEFEISPEASSIGKTLRELNFKQSTGVNIASIIRGGKRINIPDGNERLFPFDRIVVVGSDKQMQKFTKILEKQNSEEETTPHHNIELTQFIVEPDSPLIAKTVQELDIRGKTDCMIVGIDRETYSVLDIEPDTVLEEGDVLWIAGEKDKLKNFQRNIEKGIN